LVEKLDAGARIAIVSDAGMPGISDPGFRLVSLAIEHGIVVVPVPGPAAFVSALVASGQAVQSFSFRGFLPPKSGARRKELERIRDSQETQIFYEAPHRIKQTLEDIVATLGPDRHIVIARELTKVHEQFLRGTAREVLDTANRTELKGEITILIGPAASHSRLAPAGSICDRIAEIMHAEGLDEKSALKKAAKERGVSKSSAYREWQQSRKIFTNRSG
jgi:16S rRNA (cytidine1402-2'-O)-methyltransferase